MVSGTMPDDLDVYMDEDDPTEAGDIKVVQSTLQVLDVCDAVTDWAIAGAGCSIGVSTNCVEGSGAIYAYVPASTTGVLTFTHTATVDISTHKWMRFSVYRATTYGWFHPCSTNITFHAHFGEAVSTEQTMGNFTLGAGDIWKLKSWDISAIDVANRNAVKYFVLDIANGSSTKPAYVVLDYVYADVGPGAVKVYDGDRVSRLYPKVYTFIYEGTAAHQTIILPRKDAPTYIRTVDLDAAEFGRTWVYGMGNYSVLEDGSTVPDVEGIHNVVSGSFDLFGNGNGCNLDAQSYYGIALWED